MKIRVTKMNSPVTSLSAKLCILSDLIMLFYIRTIRFKQISKTLLHHLPDSIPIMRKESSQDDQKALLL
jgi:hypothetical protein